MYVLMYMDVCCMHSARTGYIYECVCTGYIYECTPHAHAHACTHARIHSYLGRLGSALSSERPPVLVLLRCFSSHPVLVLVLVLHRGAVTVSPAGPRKLFKGVTTATSGVLARFPLLLPVRNSCVSYGASTVTRTSDRGRVAEVGNQGHRSGGVSIRVSKETFLPLNVHLCGQFEA
jgi:hypothetical protein